MKAETDICCTSSNAVEVVDVDPAPTARCCSCPDQFLGAHVQRMTGRENMHIWMGECHVHAGINGADLDAPGRRPNPTPSCSSTPSAAARPRALYLGRRGCVPADQVKILSTGGMLDAARSRPRRRKVLVATETGMLHQLRKANPTTDFRAGQRAARRAST